MSEAAQKSGQRFPVLSEQEKYYKCPTCGFATLYKPPEHSQEWTPESVKELTSYAVVGREAELIAAAHNAATLDAYAKGRKHNDVAIAQPLRQQLAAAQKQRDDFRSALEERIAEVDQLRVKLAKISELLDCYSDDARPAIAVLDNIESVVFNQELDASGSKQTP